MGTRHPSIVVLSFATKPRSCCKCNLFPIATPVAKMLNNFLERDTHCTIYILAFGSVLWAAINFYIISLTPVESAHAHGSEVHSGFKHGVVVQGENPSKDDLKSKQTALLVEIYEAVRAGAHAFLMEEYKICSVFCIVFAGVIIGLVSWGQEPADGALTALAFGCGALTSVVSGYIGMTVAVYSNVRTTINAQKPGFEHCFNTAFRAGGVMGHALTGLGVLVLYFLSCLYRYQYAPSKWNNLFEAISGYGLGGSTIAMFGRVGGGIYTKAADVGADLVGKVIHGIPEDDPRNPATIADNVGDNVGDVAGMGADLFGSFAESACACLVIGSSSPDIVAAGWGAVMFPLIVAVLGLCVCFVTSFVATVIYPVTDEHKVELALRLQLVISTLLMLPMSFLMVQWLPERYLVIGVAKSFHADRLDGE